MILGFIYLHGDSILNVLNTKNRSFLNTFLLYTKKSFSVIPMENKNNNNSLKEILTMKFCFIALYVYNHTSGNYVRNTSVNQDYPGKAKDVL